MTDAFADLVTPLFENVIDFQDRLSWGEKPPLDEVKRLVRSWIEQTDQRAGVDRGLSEHFDLARFGFVAWIDEVLTDSEWGRSVHWGSEKNVLEWDLYHSNLRAERFYDMAARAERHADASGDPARGAADPLEVYLLCVALGFRGLKAQNPDEFSDWVERTYAKVSAASPVATRPFPDDEAPPGDGLTPFRGSTWLVAVSALVAMTALVTLAGYLLAVHYTHSTI
jgi:type VI secretion system protein ImpK